MDRPSDGSLTSDPENPCAPAPVTPPLVPMNARIEPLAFVPIFSPGKPTTSSARPPGVRPPAASAAPKASPASGAPGTPALSCDNVTAAAVFSPDDEPGKTVAMPASV